MSPIAAWWRPAVAVVNLSERPYDLHYPTNRTVLLLRDAGFEVHTVSRAAAQEQHSLDGVTVWLEPNTVSTARRIIGIRPELLFVDSTTYSVLMPDSARRSWVRNPVSAANPAWFAAQNAMLRRFDAVTFTNPADRETWQVAEQKLVELPYPVDVSFWSQGVSRQADWWAARAWSVPEGPVFISVAAYIRRKRVVELIEAMAPVLSAHPAAVLVLIGHDTVEPETAEAVRLRPIELGIPDQVRIGGLMPPDEIRQALAWSSLAIINTESETQCMAVYEALAAGVPVLISDIPVLTSQFPELPSHSSAEGLRHNVGAVLGDQPLREHLLAAGRERLEWSSVGRHDAAFRATINRLLGRAAL